MSRFCRHNRFVAECPICSKGTVLDPGRPAARPKRPSRTGTAARRNTGRTGAAAAGTRVSRGPFAAAGPYADGREVRLEKVPGGLRLAAWHAGQLVKDAPVVALADLPELVAEAARKELLDADLSTPTGEPAAAEAFGASPGRSGELLDELRVERLDPDRVRIARWIMRPNRGWELQEAPVLLPPARFAAALGAAVRRGVLASGRGAPAGPPPS